MPKIPREGFAFYNNWNLCQFFLDEKEKTVDQSNRKRRASLPETGNGKSPEVGTQQEAAAPNSGACDDSDETSSSMAAAATSEQKRKRRVSEEPSTSAAKSVTIVSLPSSLSVTPAFSASLAKQRGQGQDDRAKISEMLVTLKRTVNLLIQQCEGSIKPDATPMSDVGKSDAESGKRDGSREAGSKDKPEAKGKDVENKEKDEK